MKYRYVKHLQITEDDIAIQDVVRNNLERVLHRYHHSYTKEGQPFKAYRVILYQDYNCSFYSASVRVPVKYADSFLLEIKTLGSSVKVEEEAQ